MVLKRVSNIIHIEGIITKLLIRFPRYVPPLAQYWIDVEFVLPSTNSARKKANEPASKKAKVDANTAPQTKEKSAEEKEVKIEFSYYKEFVRELDMHVVILFRTPLN